MADELDLAWSQFCDSPGVKAAKTVAAASLLSTTETRTSRKRLSEDDTEEEPTEKIFLDHTMDAMMLNGQDTLVPETLVHDTLVHDTLVHDTLVHDTLVHDTPVSTPLQISTRSKISFLNRSINLATTFWRIPVLSYHLPAVGVIKKQMKFICESQEELDVLNGKCASHENVELYLISQTATSAKVPFKDVRKVSIGLCCKDITSYRRKKRKAFYNCFVMLLRILYKGVYKEMHVKVFNTGRLEITGIQTDELLDIVHVLLLDILRPIVNDGEILKLQDKESDTVLINSHFKCGYYINRERFHQILKYDYNINSSYDPCSYPGIQCEFYYDTRLPVQHGMQPATFSEDRKDLEIEKEAAKEFVQKVSFMIFRTGSVLIVGKCSDAILNQIYKFLCAVFIKEYKKIRGTTPAVTKEVVKKARKIRKKIIYV